MLSYISTKEFSFTKDENKWILEHSDKYFIISDEIKLLLEILKRNNYNKFKSYNDFINEFEFVSEDDFSSILNINLKNLELDKNSKNKKKEKSFINFETKILPKNIAGYLSRVFQPLFQPTFFWISFITLFLFTIYNIINFKNFNLDIKYGSVLVILYAISAVIHELGHIAACRYFTKKNGEIGVGVYFIFPVFYSNISPIWTVNKEKRIITNLAGVYVQLLIMTLLLTIALYTNNNNLYSIVWLMSIFVLYQLIPFIRTDGYWILSDITNSPNLLTKSYSRFYEFLKNPIKYRIKSKREFFEFIYGISSQLIMLYFVIYILIEYKFGLITQPIDFIKLIISNPNEIFNYLSENLNELIMPIIFYMLALNFIKMIYQIIKIKKVD